MKKGEAGLKLRKPGTVKNEWNYPATTATLKLEVFCVM